MSKQNSWTDDEHGFLMETLDWTAKRVAEELGRSAQSVHTKRNRIKHGWKPAMPRWSPHEDETIIAAGPLARAEDIAASLPGRAVKSVQWRRIHLGVRSINSNEKRPTTIGARPLVARTCRACGLLLQASWFSYHAPRRSWNSVCKRCASEQGGERNRKNENYSTRSSGYGRMQALTEPSAEKRYDPYTEADLVVLADPDLSHMQKALKLKRTYAAVSSACRKYGFKSHYGLGDPERDQWMIDNPNAESIEEITAMLKQPEPATPTRPDFEWDD